MRAWPLRVKLVALMLLLLTVALAITGGIGLYSTRNYLDDKLRNQLTETAPRAGGGCTSSGQPKTSTGPYGRRGPALPSGYWAACIAADGTITRSEFEPLADQAEPKLPTNINDLSGPGPFFTVPSTKANGHDWRVLLARGPDGYVLVALSEDEIDGTVLRQLWVTVGVGGGVLLVLAVVAYLLVRSSLRPLVEVEQTAEAIAAGDLTRRVPEADPRTEVGGLSTALNTMLGQIETAFEERRASEEAALASEERMRRFVADASHELRTPLTSIRGFAELHRQSGRADDNVGRIEHHATRMGLLVDDLLLLARMDQQRPLDKKPVDLLALATDALIDARVTAHDHRLRLRTQAGEDDDVEPAIVLGDEARLRQVLQNLITNALTHTPAGTEITVYVGTEGATRCSRSPTTDRA
ncbi:hypothetical protein GCM10027610_118240 [Dactylosporangium cerinum]